MESPRPVPLPGSLVEKKAVESGNLERIETLARQFVEIVKQTRQTLAEGACKS